MKWKYDTTCIFVLHTFFVPNVHPQYFAHATQKCFPPFENHRLVMCFCVPLTNVFDPWKYCRGDFTKHDGRHSYRTSRDLCSLLISSQSICSTQGSLIPQDPELNKTGEQFNFRITFRSQSAKPVARSRQVMRTADRIVMGHCWSLNQKRKGWRDFGRSICLLPNVISGAEGLCEASAIERAGCQYQVGVMQILGKPSPR